MSQRLGRVTCERRYVIIEVADEWKLGDPIPPPGPTDQWFDSVPQFVAALGAPYDHRPINRRPWDAVGPAPAPVLGRFDEKARS